MDRISPFQSMLQESRGALVTVNSLLAYQPEAHMVCTLLKSLGVGARLIEVNMIAIQPFAVFFFGPPAGAAGNPT